MKLLLPLFWGLYCAGVIFSDDFFRDKEVLYFDSPSIEAKQEVLKQITDVYTDREFATHIATLQPGVKVKVLGYHPKSWWIETIDERNRVQGWIAAERLPKPDAEWLKSAQKAAARAQELEAAIAAKQVIAGMSMEEVKKVLGKPSKVSFRHDASGKKDVWSYVKYKSVPQLRLVRDVYGNLVQVTDVIRVPVGETLVEFADEKVVAIEESRDLRTGQ